MKTPASQRSALGGRIAAVLVTATRCARAGRGRGRLARCVALLLVLLVAQFQPLALALACDAAASPAMAMVGASGGAHAAHGAPHATRAGGTDETAGTAWNATQDEPLPDCPLTGFCSAAPVFALRALEPIRLVKSLHAATMPTPARLAPGRTPAPPTPPPLA